LAHDQVALGFCSPNRSTQGRLRLAALVRQEEIVRATSPFDLLAGAAILPGNACSEALALCRDHAGALGLVLGVWGSMALELYTGLPYTDRESDLDLLVMPAPASALCRFLERIAAIEVRYELRIDAELELANGFGVHLKELFGHGRTILGKSRAEVALLGREQVLSELPQVLPAGHRLAAAGGSLHG
jgi:phosphoribosyl-dephospho-CoA transferase